VSIVVESGNGEEKVAAWVLRDVVVRSQREERRTSENLIPITYFSQGLTKLSTVIPKKDW
jgi:hypothetical protein